MHRSFILDYFQQKVMTKYYKNLRKLHLGLTLGPFSLFTAKFKKIFKISEIIREQSLRKTGYRHTYILTDRYAWIRRSSTDCSPKRSKNITAWGVHEQDEIQYLKLI